MANLSLCYFKLFLSRHRHAPLWVVHTDTRTVMIYRHMPRCTADKTIVTLKNKLVYNGVCFGRYLI